MVQTIQETIEVLKQTLTGYIEATYHISDQQVVAQRRRLLETAGGVFQTPYLESTPRYDTGRNYAQMTDIPAAAREAFLRLAAQSAADKPLVFDPPYTHQEGAIRSILQAHRNLMIMTGTGSGKTESFLLPILGKLAIEARDHAERFAAYPAVRAMVLYPMNALVNDQLGRLRTLFGDPRVVSLFEGWCGRPARFSRYTSRTPYAGVRSRQKDSSRLKSIGDFFVALEEAAERHRQGRPLVPHEDDKAAALFDVLRGKGKWPAKPSVTQWFGSGRWLNSQGGFRRAVTLADDAELLTRHEVQEAPPDLLITNYSMLEYMMLRPIERGIFEKTRAWLEAFPEERFLIVLDEAHLYRGAQGAEVGLLLRRLRERLNIPITRFQVICATASFSEEGKRIAEQFGAALSGCAPESFDKVTGDLKLRPQARAALAADRDALAAIDLARFYSERAADRNAAIAGFLAFRGMNPTGADDADLYQALEDFGPLSLLVNETMAGAKSFAELRALLFGTAGEPRDDLALNALLAMGSRARRRPEDASLLPCRVHAFFRGLPGLWACMDPNCSQLPQADRGGPVGTLYSQPLTRCGCNAPVLEYFTCRYCGSSYARAYTRDVANPAHIFAEPGETLLTAEGLSQSFEALDLLLEEPAIPALGQPADYDLISGQLDPDQLGNRHRRVYLKPQLMAAATGPDDDEDEDGDDGDGGGNAGPGQYVPCGCCRKQVRGGTSSVQDHLTKGDQPFQALLAAQLKVQPPGPRPATSFAPLRGRKVLVFSDSRQVAARLAPALQLYSLRDTLRALLPAGYRMVARDPGFGASVMLDHAWLATVVAAHRFQVRVRPELEIGEFQPRMTNTAPGVLPDTAELFALLAQRPPGNLTKAIATILRDNILGLEALAVASLCERPGLSARLGELPPLAGLAETPEDKIAIVRHWLRAWNRKSGIWFRDMPDDWWGTGKFVRSHKGDFRALATIFSTPARKTAFKRDWLPRLMPLFTDQVAGGLHRLAARHLSLEIGGAWRRCAQCTSVHRAIASVPTCVDCGSAHVHVFDPDSDLVFRARKGFYRDPILEALTSEHPGLMSLVAAEHTAQLNASQPDEAFSQAEFHEMQFQDIDLAWRDIDTQAQTSIDVLSSTTTMEVGIDIGELSGVALRNMPPGRANYQQRAGRAGRRGNAIATVVAFGSADSHDDHYFTHPQEMIRGRVVDPRLTLENPDIAKRHVRAFLLQRYHEYRLPDIDPASAGNLFSVLGSVRDFRDGTGLLNRIDLAHWLRECEAELRLAIDRWLPGELVTADRASLLTRFVPDLLEAVDRAVLGAVAGADDDDAEFAMPAGSAAQIVPEGAGATAPPGQEGDEDAEGVQGDPEPDNGGVVDAAADNLLDRLLYWGVLPRYAFPTDVAPFYVFSPRSTGFRAAMEFAPSQGLNIALSQYAPNKQIWIKGKQYTSKAIYSPYPNDRARAWDRRRMYFECSHCGHAKTEHQFDPARRGLRLTCEACHTPLTFGPGQPWMRPPGFAHPWNVAATSTPDEPNETAYATRAKLVMPSSGPEDGIAVNPRLRAIATRQHLLVSNSGPDGEGYDYCAKCGRIESTAAPEINLRMPHPLPYPNDDDEPCDGRVSRGIVLGTDFQTDIVLFALQIEAPFLLPPGHAETVTAMRTVCEALAKAASLLLEIENGEVLAEYRPALNAAGAAGRTIEVFLYDTLSGGAGFSPQLAGRGAALFETALGILDHCPNPACDGSCYRCLRSFRNKLDHGLLDRFVGAQLLRHVLTGAVPSYEGSRARQSLTLVADDLDRQFGTSITVARDFAPRPRQGAPLVVTRQAGGAPILIDLQSPIAPGLAIFGSDAASVTLLDDLVVRRHLGQAIQRIADML
jgi:ATP-dependent helicase YprA (DUF1998 family)